MTINLSVKNWKTTATGIIAFLLTVPSFVSAIQAWSAHQPVDWRTTLVSVAMAIAGVGLVAAKDASTQSTLAQATAMQAKVEGKPGAPALMEAADKQAAEAPKLP